MGEREGDIWDIWGIAGIEDIGGDGASAQPQYGS